MSVDKLNAGSYLSNLNYSANNVTFMKVFVFFVGLALTIYITVFKSAWNSFTSAIQFSPPTRPSENKLINLLKVETNNNTFVSRTRLKNEKGLSYILYWRHNWGVSTEGWGSGVDLGGCVVTYDRSKLKDAEAVIFHYSGLDTEPMPWRHYRDEDQLFLYFNHESPSYMRWGEGRTNFGKFDNSFINLTISYRSDSSIFYPYSNDLQSILDQGKSWVDKKISEKSNLTVALWVVSNCNLLYGSVARMKLSDDLFRAGLILHRYGRCFNNKHAIDKMDKKTFNSYKFYMAFENALHCKDYMTEKFWVKGIESGKIPVVWGPSKEDVTRLAPTKSFIHYEDFDSPASLASYLMYLNGNDTAYREYFNWAENPDQRTRDLVEMRRSGQKKLCDLIRAKERKRNIVKSITEFYLNESSNCFRPKS